MGREADMDRATKQTGYAKYARYLSDEPAPSYRQTSMGAHIEGETEGDLERLLEGDQRIGMSLPISDASSPLP